MAETLHCSNISELWVFRSSWGAEAGRWVWAQLDENPNHQCKNTGEKNKNQQPPSSSFLMLNTLQGGAIEVFVSNVKEGALPALCHPPGQSFAWTWGVSPPGPVRDGTSPAQARSLSWLVCSSQLAICTPSEWVPMLVKHFLFLIQANLTLEMIWRVLGSAAALLFSVNQEYTAPGFYSTNSC